MFYEDAIVASRELQITLTSRNREKGQAVPMCGVPFHAAETYIARLLHAGYKIAVCDQMEPPSPGKRLVRREVVRVITPGTAIDAHVLEPKENNFLVAVARSRRCASPINLACYAGRVHRRRVFAPFSRTSLAPGAEERLRDELQLLRPREILVARQAGLFAQAPAAGSAGGVGAGRDGIETGVEEWVFRRDYGERILSEQLNMKDSEGFSLANSRPRPIWRSERAGPLPA